MISLEVLQQRLAFETIPTSWKQYASDAETHFKDIKSCFTEEFLNEALSFYYLDQEPVFYAYYKKALPLLLKDKVLQNACALVHYILFHIPFNDFLDVWSWKESPKTQEDYMIPVFCLLSGYKIHQENFKYLPIEKQIFQRKKVNFSCMKGLNFYNIPGISFHTMAWGIYYIKGRLTQSGTFEFEQQNFNFDYNIYKNANNKIYKAEKKEHPEDTLLLTKDMLFCGVHIPRGADLSPLGFQSALDENNKTILNVFPAFQQQDMIPYSCSSWLLSPDLQDLLPPTSNIIQFQNRFEIIDTEDGLDDFLRFVFDTTDKTPLTELPEKTSLQRALKKRLLKNKTVYKGFGILKEQYKK